MGYVCDLGTVSNRIECSSGWVTGVAVRAGLRAK